MSSKLGGGKTPPRLLEDLLLYNPQRLPPSSYNVLTELTLKYDGTTPPRNVGKGACRHRWALKHEQCNLLELDTGPDSSSVYTAAAICTLCRCHVELKIDYSSELSGSLPCPTPGTPLHHFIHEPADGSGLSTIQGGITAGSWVDTQFFRCSSSLCSARLSVRSRSPHLLPEWVALLTDKSLIKSRADKAMAHDPERFEGHAVPTPLEILQNLRTYLRNAMTSPDPRKIPPHNKKWLLCFGDSCAELLQYIGFAREEADWIPPRPDVKDTAPFSNPSNILVNNVEYEVEVLLNQRPDTERRMFKIHIQHHPAMIEFERLLGSKDYMTSTQSRTIDLTQDDEHPFYGGLGTKMDFHDELISWAYERQTACDKANTPYYLECLQGIAKGRSSEDLQTKVAIEASSGKISVEDIREAYKSLGLEYQNLFYDDDTIIGMFQSRIADAPRQEIDLRRALSIIGQERDSSKIQNVASNNTVATYEQAVSWLGATEDMTDDFLVSMHGVKVHENPANEELARRCMALIAEKRGSSALQAWLETGHLGETEMDFGQAYTRLGIGDRMVDDELVLTSYNVLVQETPSQIKELKRALAAIAKSRNSFYLTSFLDSNTVGHKLSDWPVGLENIGNTCYLNSLLQFYFTVKPLRELVLNFDTYKMQSDDSGFETKRVGSRKVSKKEVDRAQRFVYELQKLFKSMISISADKVTPEQELARLTLISSSNEETIRRMSILSAHRPSIGDIDGQPILGPLPPFPAPVAITDAVMSNDINADNNKYPNDSAPEVNDEISSEGTLVESPAVESKPDHDFMIIDSVESTQQEEQVLEDKENFAPIKPDEARPSTPDFKIKSLVESSPSRANEQSRPLSPIKEGDGVTKDKHEVSQASMVTLPGPPSRPPPVPPRQMPEEHKPTVQEEVEIGAQQDVTEVIANVLFQLQCAIKAESIDDSGEQIDQIKRLFFGKQKSYITNEHGETRSKEEFISDIKVDVASGPRDIYAALDGAFDIQEVEVGGSLEPQYTTISQLPPILQVLVQRAQFDAEKKASFKSINHLELRETIYMDRYMDSSDPELIDRRQACWSWKKELAKLEARKLYLTKTELDMDIPDTLSSTAEYLKQCSMGNTDDPIEVNLKLLQSLEQESQDTKLELSQLEDQMRTLASNISSQFADLREIPYRLHSVFIHRGMVSSGHYWIFIYDFTNSMWRKYNDGYVTEVRDPSVIFEAEQSTRPATSYFLVYVRDDLRSELVESVCRDVAKETNGPQEDAVMVDDERGTADLIQWHQDFSAAEDYPQVNDPWGTNGEALQSNFW